MGEGDANWKCFRGERGQDSYNTVAFNELQKSLIFAVFSDHRTFVFKDASFDPLKFEVFLTNKNSQPKYQYTAYSDTLHIICMKMLSLFHDSLEESKIIYLCTRGRNHSCKFLFFGYGHAHHILQKSDYGLRHDESHQVRERRDDIQA